MNEALQEGKLGGSLALDFSDIQNGFWPLIEYLYADDIYRAKYNEYLEDVRDLYFEESNMQTLYTTYSNLIGPYTTTERYGYSFLNSSSEFQSAVSALKQHVASRATAVTNYLNNKK
jgi:hypothetical protein